MAAHRRLAQAPRRRPIESVVEGGVIQAAVVRRAHITVTHAPAASEGAAVHPPRHHPQAPGASRSPADSRPRHSAKTSLTPMCSSYMLVQSNGGAGGGDEKEADVEGESAQPRLPARQERPEARWQAQARRAQAGPLPAVGQAATPPGAQAAASLVADPGPRGPARHRGGGPPAPPARVSRDPPRDPHGRGARADPRRPRQHSSATTPTCGSRRPARRPSRVA